MKKLYNKKLDMELSPLGFGVMRLAKNQDGTFPAEVHKLLAAAYERGINYFDTAYPYLGGSSERLIRDALVDRYPRESFLIADKLPVWECRSRDDMERIFNVQLERLGVEYIDFYLLHALHKARWFEMRDIGALSFLDDKLKEGSVRKVGFSFHDTADVLTLILDAYDWDFAQLQINYYDWIAQHAKNCYEELEKRGIPCIVMEPVGGGRLAKLPDRAEMILKRARPWDSIASWAVRFAVGLPNVAVTLSGMSDMEQLMDNYAALNSNPSLTEEEQSVLSNVVEILLDFNTIPCTNCGYCTEDCPKIIDIPQILKKYNDNSLFENTMRFDVYYNHAFPKSRQASNCIHCGKCVLKCPQNIDIPKELEFIHNYAIELTIGVNIPKLKERLSYAAGLVCFGAGAKGRQALQILQESGCEASYFCDNSESLWGTAVEGVEVISPDQLQKLCREQDMCVLITSIYKKEIRKQLDEMGIEVFC